MSYLYRTILNGICCEIGICEKPLATIFLCPGLPGIPKEQDFVKYLVDKNYNVVYLRYRGTFESSGKFLSKSPAIDVINVIKYLKENGTFLELYKKKNIPIKIRKIIIAGGSFGGAVVLEALQLLGYGDGLISCPVTDFQLQGSVAKESAMNEIIKFIIEGYPYVYRIENKGCEKLMNNLLIRPASSLIPKINGHIIIFHGVGDTTVDPSRSKALKKFKNVDVNLIPGGHLPLSKIPRSLLLKKLKKLT